MSQLKFLKTYGGQTTDELISLEDKYRADSLVLAFEAGIQQKYDQLIGQHPNCEEMVVLAVEALEREVNNGGYRQFFFNTPEFSLIIIDALKQIGAEAAANVTQQAIDALQVDSSRLSCEAIQESALGDNPQVESQLEKLNSIYFAEIGDLSKPLFDFIKRNRAKLLLKAEQQRPSFLQRLFSRSK